MPAPTAPLLFASNLQGLALSGRGKVRDIYRIDDNNLLFVASDRLSAFDVILPQAIAGKGALLTAISNFWFHKSTAIIANHLTGRRPEDLPLDDADHVQIKDRAVIVKRLRALPVEAIVRGYLAGSAWRDYLANGAVCGLKLPPGLAQAERLPLPLFTPSSKAAAGEHDTNIGFDAVARLVGGALAEQIRAHSLALYALGRDHAAARGIIMADTKFEFGVDAAGALYLIDEVMTPDSSRLWPADAYQPGGSPPSLDKQYVRDYLQAVQWDNTAPPPALPAEVVAGTAARYQQAHDRLLA